MKVYFINYLKSCVNDVDVISNIFSSMGYELQILNDNLPYDKWMGQIRKNDSEIIVIYFGFGYGDNIFLGEDMISYQEFFKMFCPNYDKSMAVFTNTCFKYKTTNVSPITISQGNVKNVQHMCIEVIGKCKNGSLFSKALQFIFESSDNHHHHRRSLEFVKISEEITKFIEDRQEFEKDYYIVTTWHYKEFFPFFFRDLRQNEKRK